MAPQKVRPAFEVLLDQAHRLIAADLGERKLPQAARVIQEMREERDAQLIGVRRLR